MKAKLKDIVYRWDEKTFSISINVCTYLSFCKTKCESKSSAVLQTIWDDLVQKQTLQLSKKIDKSMKFLFAALQI